ncbi:MAG: hypothetical protein ACJ8C4_18870 [Gemmataceae bacterium]
MIELDLDRVRADVVKATNEDLLDRITVYRPGMEAQALALIEAELARRGVSEDAIRRHEEKRSEAMRTKEGWAVKCCKCRAPAVVRRWGWLRLWNLVPIAPWHFRYCQAHAPLN